MTRRKFIRKLAAACSAVVVGAGWLAKKAAPRRFVLAVRTKFYPGSLKPLGDISKPGKWSG
ncbi:MAG TPA: twin-arginine translocation signal domain-containing protein [Sedimentisphaerales bacterium]|nr:twin-arginine translocation signal domain-containing protein [Sedimentisphaerales bacterium]